MYFGKDWAGDARGFMFIDVNGSYKGPNEFGKDLFKFKYIQTNSGASIGNGLSIYPHGFVNNDGNQILSPSRNDLLGLCRKSGNTKYANYCAALIIYDGWKISKDYPW